MLQNAFKQFFFVKSLYYWAIYIFNTYYITFIFAQTNDPSQVILNIFYTYLSIFLGYIAGNIIMGKIGVEKTLRSAFILFVLTGLIGIFLTGTPYNSYILVSILRGLAGGMFWAAMNFMESSAINPKDRSRFYSLTFGASTIFNVIAPIVLGAVLEYFVSYVPIYLIFSLMCIVGAVYPYSFNIKKDMELTRDEFVKVLKEVNLTKFEWVKFSAAIVWATAWIISALVPILVLGNELNMGLFLGGLSLIAGIVSIKTRNLKIMNKVHWGTISLIVTTLATIPLMFDISMFSLTIYWVVSSVTASILTPVELDLDMKITNMLTISKKADTETLVLQETIYMLARMLIVFLALIGLRYLQLEHFIGIIALVMALSKVVHYILAADFLNVSMLNKSS